MAISKSIIENIKEKTNIVNLINCYVTLKKQGKNHIGLCPFHEEKTASFNVNEVMQFFYCFGCKVGGDIFHFLMKYNNYTFYESIIELAKPLGINFNNFSQYKKQDSLQCILEIYNQTAKVYHQFLHNKKGYVGKNYLIEKRYLNKEIINTFKLGYTTNKLIPIKNNNTFLNNFLSEKNYSYENQLKSTVIIKKNNIIRDYFYNRIIFPIFDENNRIIAFGGRVLDNSNPKYINSPENYFFQKRKILYGLNEAKNTIQKKNAVIVMEGYFDVIIAHQKGLKNTVALLGTSLTKEHIHKLKRYTNTIILIFDGDVAGETGIIHSIKNILNSDLNIKIALLPKKMDPYDFIIQKGIQNFNEIISKAKSSIDYLLESELNKNPITSYENKKIYINKIYHILNDMNNQILKEEIINKMSKLLNISVKAITENYNNFNKLPINKYQSKSQQENINYKIRLNNTNKIDNTEKYLILTLLNNTNIFNKIMSEKIETYLTDSLYKKIFENMNDLYKNTGEIELDSLLNEFKESEYKKILSELFKPQYQQEQAEQIIYECIQKLKLKKIKNEKNNIIKIYKKLLTKNSSLFFKSLEEEQFLINEEKKIKQI